MTDTGLGPPVNWEKGYYVIDMFKENNQLTNLLKIYSNYSP